MDDYTLDVSGDDGDEVLALLDPDGVSGEPVVGYDDDDDGGYNEEEISDLVGGARRGVLTRASVQRLGSLLAKRGKFALKQNRRAKRRLHDQKQKELARVENLPQIQMGIVSAGLVVAGTAATIIATPTVPIRVTDFFVDASISAAFTIDTMLVGRINLFASGDAVPASVYDPTAGLQRAPLEIRRVPAGSPISLIVTNTSLADAVFRGVFQVIDLGTRVY